MLATLYDTAARISEIADLSVRGIPGHLIGALAQRASGFIRC
jgi:site-specific recombinase XerD